MSLLPYVLSELHDLAAALDDRRPVPVAAPRWERGDLGLGLLDDLVAYRDALRPARPLLRLLDVDDEPEHHQLVIRPRHLLRRHLSAPYRRALQRHAKEAKEVTKKDDGLLINVDVQQFRPEELSVQVLKDERCVVVEGKHEERADEHGYVQRQFTRRYKLPDYVDPETITSKLTPDGVLQVSAPRKEALPAPKENVRHVTITQTDQPAIQDAADESVGDKDKKKEEAVAAGKDKPQSNVSKKSKVVGA
ncbi:Protein lethal(2)essential for life [Frankliniella fusca]|uniref:Protein lethal(2)essential for life n=1 Tax=Frankliniella fusca TaxID=407009 RepID=A0AAE1HTF0_9NEOP|nr:Protein lethal(2)essential for life [Frankliniella fusca]